MAVINKYTAHTIEPDILSRLNVDQAGDVVSAETWVALWDLVLHLLAKYNEHFVDIYRTLEELGTEVDTCIKRIDSLEKQYQSLEERMGNLETSWSALQDAYNKVAGHYEEIKHIQESLEGGFVHYGEEPPATNFIKLWVMPTQGIPSLITSWGENDILATNYNYASAKLIKDSLNTKVNKAGDTMTGTLNFNCRNTYALYGVNPAYVDWYVNWDGDFRLWSGVISTSLDIGGKLVVGTGSQRKFSIDTYGDDPSVVLHNLRLTGLKHPTMPDDAAHKQYVDDSHLPAIKKYVDPKLEDIEINKFQHTPYTTVLNEVTVDTPEPYLAYVFDFALGLVEGNSYTVNFITALGNTGSCTLIATKPDEAYGVPEGVLLLTDDVDMPNVTILDCLAENNLFDATKCTIYADSLNLDDTTDNITQITIQGVNATVCDHYKLPHECLDLKNFIDSIHIKPNAIQTQHIFRNAIKDMHIQAASISRSKLKSAYTTYSFNITEDVAAVQQMIKANAKHILIHGVLKTSDTFERMTIRFEYANNTVYSSSVEWSLSVDGKDLRGTNDLHFKIELRKVEDYIRSGDTTPSIAYYSEIVAQTQYNAVNTAKTTTHLCRGSDDTFKYLRVRLTGVDNGSEAASIGAGSYINIDVLDY